MRNRIQMHKKVCSEKSPSSHPVPWKESESRSVVSDSLWPCGILQARMLERVAFPFSRGSSQPRDQTQVSCITGIFFTIWATREAQDTGVGSQGRTLPGNLPNPGIESGSPALQEDWMSKQKRDLWDSCVSLFQILKDDALKVLHSICQQIWKTQQWL